MKVISYIEKDKWNTLVKSFVNWDVYYLCEYSISLMKHGDGEPCLLYYEDEKSRLCFVVMINDIADMQIFENILIKKKYFDMETPYGYGGPIIEGDFDEICKERFMCELIRFCEAKNIITQFVRFHPLYQNQIFLNGICEIRSTKETIVIDTSFVDIINQNMDSKNRNMVRKAKKLGVTIISDNGERIDDFIRIYESTMDKNNAGKYYYFERSYYEYLKMEMKNNVIFFYACLGEEIISAAIFFFNDNYMHYHLSGSMLEYRHIPVTNLLIYEAALWGCERGIKFLHLGGGVTAVDSLFGFKKQFNKNGYLPYFIGRNIFDESIYNKLLQKRKEVDCAFNIENPFFIQYRK